MGRIIVALLFLSALGVRAQPEIKGGLNKFMLANKVYPPYSLQNCIEGTVSISFKLNHRGEIYFSYVQKGMGTDLDDEALRLIRMSSGKWVVPAGHDTTVSIVVPVNFKLDNFGCANKSRAEIKEAIEAYQSRTALTDAILNFYKNKHSGKFTKEEENRIIALKKSLGYDDEYLAGKLDSGRKKLRQNDKQGACEDFLFIKYMGSDQADELLAEYCN